MKEKGNRIKGMDGLRGIAIIGITGSSTVVKS